MKRNIELIFSFFLLVAIFTSCNKVYVTVISKTPEFNYHNVSNATIIGTGGVFVSEFKKTFDNRYKQKCDFIKDYTNQFQSKLQNEGIYSIVKADTSTKWNVIKSFSGSKEDFNIIDSLYKRCKTDYIINICNLEVSNRNQIVTTRSGYNGTMTTSNTEYCIIKANFQIIDTKNRKVVLEFCSIGESKVFLFAFETAFEAAMLNSVDHALAYLKNGQVEFRNI